MRPRFPLLMTALLLAAAPAAHAQYDDYEDEEWYDDRYPTGGYFGGGFIVASPRGEFADHVDDGFGGRLFYAHRLDRDGWLALRIDGGMLNYGHERQRVPLSPTLGGRIRVDLTTANNLAFLGVGPQIGVPNGRLRPYAHGFAGVSYLWTQSSLEGTAGEEPFATTTNFDDATFAWGGGAGVYVPLRRGVSPISLDLGLTYFDAGEAEYLPEGGITDHDDGSITLHPVRSQTDLLSFHLGITVGISRR
ncbi:MAG TPA: hypothetical protein VFX98_04795 [Longimicrobiaceae bacterium]|nr:hypothetical protein [Longimicrobiaceae bacterium]